MTTQEAFSSIENDAAHTFESGKAKPIKQDFVCIYNHDLYVCLLSAAYCHVNNVEPNTLLTTGEPIVAWAESHYGLTREQIRQITHGFDSYPGAWNTGRECVVFGVQMQERFKPVLSSDF